jgi:predicted ABC-class ATPase
VFTSFFLLVFPSTTGKSTTLQAIAFGIYDKIPGDGRELCVSVTGAVTVRAEDGRYVNNCNISAFISNLPTPPGVEKALDTQHFSSRDSSGSTSQAANVVEAIEMGATAMLVDEDIRYDSILFLLENFTIFSISVVALSYIFVNVIFRHIQCGKFHGKGWSYEKSCYG